MMNLRRLFLLLVAFLCQFPAHVALASAAFRIEGEHFTLRLDESTYRFINARETARIMIEDWGNPSAQVMEQNPLGMIVAHDYPKSGSWGIVITASHDGHVSDKDAARITDEGLLQILRKEYFRMNKDRKAIGAEPVTRLDWALEPQYDRNTGKLFWAKDIGFGKNGTRTLNYAVRILGRENALHLNAVGSMDQLEVMTRTMQAILAGSGFDEGYRYQDFNALYHRKADYGLVALIAGQPKLKMGPLQSLWNRWNATSGLLVVSMSGLLIGLGRWMTRRRLPEF